MTRKSRGEGQRDPASSNRPRLASWQKDRVFRHNRGWVPVKRCAGCQKTSHMDHAGEWDEGLLFDHRGATPDGWRWYCGLHCLRDGTASRELKAFAGTSRSVDRLQQGPPRETGHIGDGAAPATVVAPPERFNWADDGEETGGGIRFGDFPPADVKTKM